MKVIVTGFTGFIGFHLTKRLLEMKSQGVSVLGIDRNSSYDVNRERFDDLLVSGLNEFEIGDIRDMNMFGIVKRFQPTHVIHLAALAGVGPSMKEPEEYMSNNTESFARVLKACEGNPAIKRIIYASSSNVYGDKTRCFDTEHDLKPMSHYGVSKLANEHQARVFNASNYTVAIGVRFFSVYGPLGRPEMVLNKWMSEIEEGKPITIFSSGNQKRAFTYIDDVVDCLLSMTDPRPVFQFYYNIGNPESVSLNTLKNILEINFGKKIEVNSQQLEHVEVFESFPDMFNFERTFGKRKWTTLEEGVAKIMNQKKERTKTQ